MSTITTNQRRSYTARALDDARRLADSLRNISEAQAAAVIATLVAASGTPIDLRMNGEPGDEIEAFSILDGVLARASGPYAWKLGSGCIFEIDMEANHGRS